MRGAGYLAGLVVAAGLAVQPVWADYVTGLDPQGDNYLSLRSGPGSGHAELRRMGPDTIVTVLEASGNWRRVQLQDGMTGWAYARYIAPGLPPGAAPDDGPAERHDDGPSALAGQTGAVAVQTALRPLPFAPAGRGATVEPGGGVIVLGEADGWLRVLTVDGRVGYVERHEITIGARPAPAAAASASGKGDAAGSGLPPGSWTTYANPRFGTAIDYPSDYFRPGPAPANDDGRRFASIDGRAEFMVFGQFNALNRTLDELRAEDLEWGGYDSVSYDRMGPDWYVLSGLMGDRVYYRKVLLRQGGEVLHVMQITYPTTDKPRLDPVTARMSQSFHGD